MSYYDDELMHYGVKGMKWGVRKTPEYKTYSKVRKKLTNDAELDGRWDIAYSRKVKQNQKRLDRKIDRDKQNLGYISDKTKKLSDAHERLKRDAAYARQRKNASMSTLQQFVDKSIKEFGKENVKDIKTFTYKGERYVKKFMSSDPAEYSVQRRKTINRDGLEEFYWQPVKTYYYYY